MQTGPVAPLGPQGVPSGFVKSPVRGPVNVGPTGLLGDEQADLTVHGGPDKAVYLYPAEHYPRWTHDAPRHGPMFVPGAFGENLTTHGLEEDAVSVGQVLRIGTVELQVTQPRQPCFKLGLRFDDNSLGRMMVQSGRTGWYARVLTPGALQAGDPIHVLRVPNPKWSIARFNAFIPRRREARAQFAELAALEGVAESWQMAAREALNDAGPP